MKTALRLAFIAFTVPVAASAQQTDEEWLRSCERNDDRLVVGTVVGTGLFDFGFTDGPADVLLRRLELTVRRRLDGLLQGDHPGQRARRGPGAASAGTGTR